ncbi:MAG: YabP/YqfC family sporulation protein [Eubacteriales bacterium]|jgi:sporulation protein YabP|nr:YabP/YqfC family sporulation protein [Eubacteriales bacterium]
MPQINEESARRGHTVTLLDRRTLNITGAEDVLSFDENSVIIRTALGLMTVDGEGLRIVKLNADAASTQQQNNVGPGGVIIEGKIGGVFYTDDDSEPKKAGMFGRRK